MPEVVAVAHVVARDPWATKVAFLLQFKDVRAMTPIKVYSCW
ncbi:MAG TPA: hypothetical protein V6D37_02820 [Candidatus Sericytochromatia bacterium]